MSTTTDLATLKINYLTQAQYDQAVQDEEINENELYMTPASDLIDVQVNGTSVLSNGVANIPIAGNDLGAVKTGFAYGVKILTGNNAGIMAVDKAAESNIKAGTQNYLAIVPFNQDLSVFYGLAKIAGADEKNSTLTAGTYSENAKSAIQNMLGIENIPWSTLAHVEADAEADSAYAIGDVFVYDGKLYKATAAIAVNDTIIPNTNCTETNIANMYTTETWTFTLADNSTVTKKVVVEA